MALIESIRSELDLVESNLANTTLAVEHAAHVHDQLDEHTLEDIEERNERLATELPVALEDLPLSVANSTAQQYRQRSRISTTCLVRRSRGLQQGLKRFSTIS